MQCQSKTPWRNITHLAVSRQGAYVILDIRANAFLHHMVRNITGSLLEVGMGNRPESWVAEVLAARNRDVAGATAKAGGLYLVDVTYPDHFGLPRMPLGPLWLPDCEPGTTSFK